MRRNPDAAHIRLLIQVFHTPPRIISKRFDFVELTATGEVFGVGQAPYLDYSPASDDIYRKARASQITSWDLRNMETLAVNWAIEHSLPEHQDEIASQVVPATQRSREQVRKRLNSEINYWDTRHAELLDQETAGKTLKRVMREPYWAGRDTRI